MTNKFFSFDVKIRQNHQKSEKYQNKEFFAVSCIEFFKKFSKKISSLLSLIVANNWCKMTDIPEMRENWIFYWKLQAEKGWLETKECCPRRFSEGKLTVFSKKTR